MNCIASCRCLVLCKAICPIVGFEQCTSYFHFFHASPECLSVMPHNRCELISEDIFKCMPMYKANVEVQLACQLVHCHCTCMSYDERIFRIPSLSFQFSSCCCCLNGNLFFLLQGSDSKMCSCQALKFSVEVKMIYTTKREQVQKSKSHQQQSF